jgi:SnoaL-like domain
MIGSTGTGPADPPATTPRPPDSERAGAVPATGAASGVASGADVVDRLAVEETLYRYWAATDARDWPTIRELFTADARGRYWGGKWLEGVDAVVTFLSTMTADSQTMHHLGKVTAVAVDGRLARASSYLVAQMMGKADPDAVLVSVGTYVDELRNENGVWKISLKDYSQGWVELRRADQRALLR